MLQERISVFDIFKIGIGPSSSHTMGPWRAAQAVIRKLKEVGKIDELTSIKINLYGSLAKTGKGHGTNRALMMGLSGEDPETIEPSGIEKKLQRIKDELKLAIPDGPLIPFNPDTAIVHVYEIILPFHPNGLVFEMTFQDGTKSTETYYSVGGGFIVCEGQDPQPVSAEFSFPIDNALDILRWTRSRKMSISEVVMKNELSLRTEDKVKEGLIKIWQTMLLCIYRGCHTEGILPGGLKVHRRASSINKRLIRGKSYHNPQEWILRIRESGHTFEETLNWVTCFALAVNEENAAFGRVVTAPTNGAAGVIPAALLYLKIFRNVKDEEIIRFLLVAGELGSVFKKGSTLSAAMGGCQAEIGVSSAMAAAGLTECLDGSPERVLMAAEIAMEHHLGLTCDPVGGLVQIPCIERNTMGVVKAITASQIAMESDPENARVSLDEVIKSMWETALDMNSKYKETSEGGLAKNIPVNLANC